MNKVKFDVITISTINELLSKVKDYIERCYNTQFFISYELIKKLLNENSDIIIWKEEVTGSIFYNDYVEKAYLLYGYEQNEKKLFQIHFIKANLSYILITFFATKGIVYRNYFSSMDEIIIINTD